MNYIRYYILKYFRKYRSRKLDLFSLKNRLLNLESDSLKIISYLINTKNAGPEDFKIFSSKKQSEIKEPELFNSLPFQCGGIIDELPLILWLIKLLKPQSILEIGVANGFSSSFILDEVLEYKQNRPRITTIDLPLFESSRKNNWYNRFLNRLSKDGFTIENNHDVSDIKPGGIIPDSKYANWMTNPSSRNQIKYDSYYGNAFNVLRDLNYKFDFIVIDAMKDYKSRYELLCQVFPKLNPKGIIILDGEWINSSMRDFAHQNNLRIFSYGRLGLIIK